MTLHYKIYKLIYHEKNIDSNYTSLLFQSLYSSTTTVVQKNTISLYGSDNQQKMDVYIPTNTEENTLCSVDTRWWLTAGNKDDDRWIQDYLYNNKIASANINYRLNKYR
ncbi:MAG: hypothetical protein R2777_10430 [Chitinophagales bacterium]